MYNLYKSSIISSNKRQLWRLFSLLFLGIFFISCVSEMMIQDINDYQGISSGKYVNLSIRVPKSSISTYASEEGTAEENHIDTLFINILEDNKLIETIKLYGAALQTSIGSNDTTVHVARELDNLSGGTLTAEVFANRTEVIPITSEIPLPDKNDPATWFMMSGSGALVYNGMSYHGTIHLVRNVAKLRVRISKHPAIIPADLIIHYDQIKVEVLQVPDRTQLMAPPPVSAPAGLTYLTDYASHTGNTLRPETPIASFAGGQIDSLYLNENYLNDSDYNDLNKTLVKITVPTQEPGKPVKMAEYTYPLYTEGGYQIKRNHVYILDIKIAGQTLDPHISIDMLPWNDVEVPGDIHGSFLNIDKSKVYLSPIHTQANPAIIDYHTDNTSITLDWSKVNPAHYIDTSVKFIQGMKGQIRFVWTGDGAPDFSYKDTLNILAGNIVKSIILEYNVPEGSFGNWVGAFYRWNQTGERIIKIRNTGVWSATVTQGAGFIRLNSETTRDAQWGTSSATLGNDAGFDASYPVLGTATSLSGNGIIYFRIGLTGALSHIGAQPRYGVIEVTTGEGVKKIYVRQGEEADYLMHPDDSNPDNAHNRRPYTVKFSPYNLADPYRGTGGGAVASHNDILLSNIFDSRRFTDYPTQAGYFYQWNLGAGNTWRAFNPVNTIQAITGWETGSKGSWDRMLEPCPPGYRHPNDSLQSPLTSEIRQSLYATPNSDTYGPSHPAGIKLDNSVWGYYAVGFFDRLPVGTSPNAVDSTTVSFNPSNLSAPGNTGVAYSGLLIYNPATAASLFMPASGLRESGNDGALTNAGTMAAYWTSSQNGNNGRAFLMTPTSSYIFNNTHQSNGASVRCVKYDFGLPGSRD